MVLKLRRCTNDVKWVWEWCKYVWYSSVDVELNKAGSVWEWCKYVWYSSRSISICLLISVWEWCKYVWYSSNQALLHRTWLVWEWCKYVWYSSVLRLQEWRVVFENDVNMYGTQAYVYDDVRADGLRMM